MSLLLKGKAIISDNLAKRPPTKSCPGKRFFLDKQIQYPGEQLISHTKCGRTKSRLAFVIQGSHIIYRLHWNTFWAWDGSLNKASDITRWSLPASPFPGFHCAGCPLQKAKDNTDSVTLFLKERCVSLFRFSALTIILIKLYLADNFFGKGISV